MKARELAVEGAFEFSPEIFPDQRGLFVSPLQERYFTSATGKPFFRVAQTNHSMSKRGTIRGIHYTRTPPGTAKYVYCARGAAIDIAVDLRIGSPTYGKWDSSVLDTISFRSTYLPVGVGHAFIALQDDTVMAYLVSQNYVAEDELAISVFDETIGLPIPEGQPVIVSKRDRAAPTLAVAAASGLIPDYEACLKLEEFHTR